MATKVLIFKYADYKKFLVDELQARMRTNKRYSMRTFSRDLGLRPTALSDVLADRYGLSSSMATMMASKLGLQNDEATYFISLVELIHGRSSIVRKTAETRLRRIRGGVWKFKKLSTEKFNLISKWYQPVILELVTMNPKISEDEIVRVLNLGKAEVRRSIELLESLGFLVREGGVFVRIEPFIATDSPTPEATIRSFHKNMLRLAQDAIDDEPAVKRKSVSTVLSFKLSDLPAARNELDTVTDQFVEKFEAGKKADSVFAVTIQLFRLDRHGEVRKK